MGNVWRSMRIQKFVLGDIRPFVGHHSLILFLGKTMGFPHRTVSWRVMHGNGYSNGIVMVIHKPPRFRWFMLRTRSSSILRWLAMALPTLIIDRYR